MLLLTFEAYRRASALVAERNACGMRIIDPSQGAGAISELVIGPVTGPGRGDLELVLPGLRLYLDDHASRRLAHLVLHAAGGFGALAETDEQRRLRAAAPGDVAGVLCGACERGLARLPDDRCDACAHPTEQEIRRLVTAWGDDLDLLVRFDAHCARRDRAA